MILDDLLIYFGYSLESHVIIHMRTHDMEHQRTEKQVHKVKTKLLYLWKCLKIKAEVAEATANTLDKVELLGKWLSS